MADNFQPFAEEIKLRESVEKFNKSTTRLSWAMLILAAAQLVVGLTQLFGK